MKKSVLIKGFTLLSSTTLVTLFLIYRTGFFDHYSINSNNLQTSHNGGLIKSTLLDTTKKNRTKPTMLSSSKVIILTDKKTSYWDSIKNPSKKQPNILRETEILSSSKSAIIFKPAIKYKTNFDSLAKQKLDTIGIKKKKTK